MGAMKNKKSNNEDLNKKERHIVTWSQQEDDILREQISIHGTDNWTIIASKFKDKTTRQCRRRWYTYLNSDFKKGGWSPEEDLLLCEAQKVFGNRWTEIAKVVSGRTDNAVKNRFSTLCKKRAKFEAMVKENSSYINLNNKRVVSRSILQTDDISQLELHCKKIRRTCVTDPTHGEYSLHKQSGMALDQQLRTPLAVLVQNINSLTGRQSVSSVNEIFDNTHNNKIQETFLKKDDPKIAALMQQADLLSSLAEKVSTEKTDQSFESAWKVLQEFLNQGKGGDSSGNMSGISFQQEGFREKTENLRRPNEDSQTSWRHLELSEESPASSEYSTGSAILLHTSNDRTEETQTGGGAVYKYNEYRIQSLHTKPLNGTMDYENGTMSGITAKPENLQAANEQINGGGVDPALSKVEFGSPIQLTPLFTSLAAGIPSPKFSESERHFLMKTLGMESPASNNITNSSHPPPCKRALLQSF